MVDKIDFLSENFDNFIRELSEIINKYDKGLYKTSIDESEIPEYNLSVLTNKHINNYLELCSYRKILSDIYNTDYVNKIIQWAGEHGFNLVFPEEMKHDYDMDAFALCGIAKKVKGFDIRDYFSMTFSKEKKHPLGGWTSYIVSIPLLDFENNKFKIYKKIDKIISGINRMEADIP